VRANERNAALLAAYTPKPGKPFTEATVPVTMIDPPSLKSGNAFWTVNSVPRAFSPKAASKCGSVISPSLTGLALAGAREQDVALALFPLDRIEQAVEVVEIGRVTAPAGHVPANQLDGLIERLLPPTRDENLGTFFNKRLALASPQTTVVGAPPPP
jgi:hypothetical protein